LSADFRLKTAPQHAENQTIAERRTEFLNQIKDKASLVPLGSMYQTEIRIKTGFKDGPPNLPVKDSVDII
jgi:hypothetical protein